MRALARCFALIGALLAAGCMQPTETPRYVTNFDHVQVGMPRLKVRELLGEPDRADYNKHTSKPVVYAPGASPAEREEIARALGGGEPAWSERWQYGRFSLGDFSDVLKGSDKAFIVYFNRDAAVVGVRRPKTATAGNRG